MHEFVTPPETISRPGDRVVVHYARCLECGQPLRHPAHEAQPDRLSFPPRRRLTADDLDRMNGVTA